MVSKVVGFRNIPHDYDIGWDANPDDGAFAIRIVFRQDESERLRYVVACVLQRLGIEDAHSMAYPMIESKNNTQKEGTDAVRNG